MKRARPRRCEGKLVTLDGRSRERDKKRYKPAYLARSSSTSLYPATQSAAKRQPSYFDIVSSICKSRWYRKCIPVCHGTSAFFVTLLHCISHVVVGPNRQILHCCCCLRSKTAVKTNTRTFKRTSFYSAVPRTGVPDCRFIGIPPTEGFRKEMWVYLVGSLLVKVKNHRNCWWVTG